MFFSRNHIAYYEFVYGKEETSRLIKENTENSSKMLQNSSTSSSRQSLEGQKSTLKTFWSRKLGFNAVIPRILATPNLFWKKKKEKKTKRITFVELNELPRSKSFESPVYDPNCSASQGTQTLETSLQEKASSRESSPQPGTSKQFPTSSDKHEERTRCQLSTSRQHSTTEGAAHKYSGRRKYDQLQKNSIIHQLARATPIVSGSQHSNSRPRSKSSENQSYTSLSSPPSPAPNDPDEDSRRHSFAFPIRRTCSWEDLSPSSENRFRIYSSRTDISTNYYEYDELHGRIYTSEPCNISVPNYDSHIDNRFIHRPKSKMNSVEEHERKITMEFCHLLEKSKQLFNGLRELPQYGHRQWHSCFGRTFDNYSKLWKFQQLHRDILDSKYGLKRWQIGEIASKIGQLYYHFYLRTSETAYLSEAFSFYSAIRERRYYTQACKEDKCELMVKKLRYYARYIVVCLLLKKLSLVRDLIKELEKQIVEYGMTYDPEDQIEWTVVLDEVRAFIIAESVVSIIHPENYTIVLSHRLNVMCVPPPERLTQTSISLQEAVIVGSISQQVKFSELTMDMYRILQTLEWEPTGDMPQIYTECPRYRFSMPQINKGYNSRTPRVGGDVTPRRENPHKYLLFRPSAAQILVYLASGCYDLPSNGALLLYISAEALVVPPLKNLEDGGYDVGGLITNMKTEIYRDRNNERKKDRERDWVRERERERDRDKDQSRDSKPGSSKFKEQQCIHPGDLYPFTRCPLFIIIDSENSYVFQNIPRHFGQPLVVLMSPLDVPSIFPAEHRKNGSLFTLFLHSPLSAFCFICNIETTSLIQWERAQSYIETFLIETSHIMLRHRIDPTFIAFMADDFLRLILLRYIFCEVSLRMHRGFRAQTHLPRSTPPLPDDLLEHPALVHIVMDLAVHLQVRSHFHDTSGLPPTKEFSNNR